MKAYILKCKQKHAVAFFQWRKYFSKSKSNPDWIEEIIEDRAKMMDEMYERRMGFMLTPDTEKWGNLEIIDNDIYQLNDSQNAIYKVNSLESIGWNDPFPNDLP